MYSKIHIDSKCTGELLIPHHLQSMVIGWKKANNRIELHFSNTNQSAISTTTTRAKAALNYRIEHDLKNILNETERTTTCKWRFFCLPFFWLLFSNIFGYNRSTIYNCNFYLFIVFVLLIIIVLCRYRCTIHWFQVPDKSSWDFDSLKL